MADKKAFFDYGGAARHLTGNKDPIWETHFLIMLLKKKENDRCFIKNLISLNAE